LARVRTSGRSPHQRTSHTVAKQRKSATKPSRRRDKKGGPGSGRRKPCPYCKDKIEQVDYKDVDGLRRFISEKGKIRSRRITGACRRHQNQIGRAVKRARELALLPYVAEPRGDDRGRSRDDDRGRDRDR
jgi:small subunit ribosomal protein S18